MKAGENDCRWKEKKSENATELSFLDSRTFNGKNATKCSLRKAKTLFASTHFARERLAHDLA